MGTRTQVANRHSPNFHRWNGQSQDTTVTPRTE